MNQILMTEDNNRNYKAKKPKVHSNKPIGTSSIVKVFAILILIFGLALVGNTVYAMMQSAKEAQLNKEPEVTTQRSGNEVTIIAKCESGIRTMVYSWNDSTEKVIFGRNNTELKQTINIPTGESRLNITIINSKGKQSKFVKNYIQEAKDVTEPVIKIDSVNADIKITITDDTALDYVVYKYGDSDEVKITANPDNPTLIERTIQARPGQYTLKIEAVDKAQNYATKEQDVKGVNKPVIEVTPDPNDPSYIIIKATDEEGLRMISYYINQQEYKTDPNTSLNTKTFEWRQKVEKGQSNVTVHAYSINEQVTEFKGIYNY